MGFQHFAHGNQGQDHGGGFKIEFMHIRHDGSAVPSDLGIGHGKESVGAVHEGSAGSQGNQSVHVWSFVPQAFKSADKEFLVDHHDNDRQEKLQNTHGDMVIAEKFRYRPSPHHVPHRKIHQYEQKAQRSEKTAF